MRRLLVRFAVLVFSLLALLTSALLVRSFFAADSWTWQDDFTEAQGREALSLPRRDGDNRRVVGNHWVSAMSSRGIGRLKISSDLGLPLNGGDSLMPMARPEVYGQSRRPAAAFGPGPGGAGVSGIGPRWLFVRWANATRPGPATQRPGFVGETWFLEVRAPLGLLAALFVVPPAWCTVRWWRRRYAAGRGFDLAPNEPAAAAADAGTQVRSPLEPTP